MSKKNQFKNPLSDIKELEYAHAHAHESHKDVIKRLKRASGHLIKVISMVEEGHECIDITMQLHAVVKALIEAKKNLIHDHIDHCLDNKEFSSDDLKEFKEIAKFL